MVVSKFMTYFFRAVIARFLDPSSYGQFSLGLAALSLVNTLALMAMAPAIKKYVSEFLAQNDEASAIGVIYSSIGIVVPLSLLGSVFLFFSAGFLATEVFNTQNPQQLKSIIQILAFVPVFGNMLDLLDAVALAYKKVKYEVMTEMIFRNIVQLVTVVIFLALGFEILSAAISWLFGVIFGVIFIAVLIERNLGSIFRTDIKPNYMPRKLLNFSAPLILGSMVGTLLGHSDTLLLGYFLTDTQVGIYNVAFPTAALIVIPYQALNKLALPSISDIKERNEEEIPDVIKTLTRWSISVSLPVFALIVLFSEQVIQLLFGPQYISGALALIILAFGRFVQTATGHLGSIIQTYEETQIVFKNSLLKLVLNIILNITLIPIIGIVGAAIATAGTTIFMNLLLAAEVYYIKRIHPFSLDGFKPVLACIPAIAVVYFFLKVSFETVPMWSLVPGGILFGIIYIVSLININGIKEEDRSIIIGIGRKMGEEEKAEKLADIMIR
jgi:O-antigen/teichoic acid export membrane protein